jgi:hypothetical protein
MIIIKIQCIFRYAPYFLPAHARGNRSHYEAASSLGNNAGAGSLHDNINMNDGFGVGTWAVLIDARPLRLSEDGDLLSYFSTTDEMVKNDRIESEVEAESEVVEGVLGAKNADSDMDSHLIGFDSTDGSLDDPKENVRRIRAA